MSKSVGQPAILFKLLLAPIGIVLLMLANRSLNRQDFSAFAATMLIVGVALWAADTWLARGAFSSHPVTRTTQQSTLFVRWWPLAVAASAGLATWVWSSDNTFRLPGVMCWVLCGLAWFVAWWPKRPDAGRLTWAFRPQFVLNARDTVLIAAVIMAVVTGAFFRFYRLDETPLDPTSDHAEKLLDVTDVLEGKSPIFFKRNTGREPSQFYFTAGYIRLFDLPVTFTTLKAGTAFIGTLSIIFVFLLAAELAGRMTGLFAATLYAIGTWPVEISRAGLRFPYALLATAAVLWLLLRWMRTRDRRDALFCGLSTGIGLYGYTPFRIVVLAVCLGIAFTFVASKDGGARRRVLGDGLLIGATAGVVFVPLGRYALENREMFWYRSGGRLTGDVEGKSAFGAFLDQLPDFLQNNWNAFKGFNWRGDVTTANALRYAPMLDEITGAFFLAGLAALAIHIVRRRDSRALFVLAAIPILLLSSTLALAFPWENPSVNREAPAAAIVFTIAAVPLAILVRRILGGLGDVRGTLVAVPAIAVLIATSAVQNYDEYFHGFDRQTRSSSADTVAIARAIEGAKVFGVLPEDAYVIDWPHWLDIRNIGIALGDIDWGPAHNVVLQAPLPEQTPGRPLLFILNADDKGRLAEVQRAFPDCYVAIYPADESTIPFVTVFVPPAIQSDP